MSLSSDYSSSYSYQHQFTKAGKTFHSACSISQDGYDFIDFLGVAQSLKVDFLPISWQPALDRVGEGGTAEIRQALINLQTTFAFKRFKKSGSSVEEAQDWHTLIAEISILGHPTVRKHPNIVKIEGICWDVVSGGEQVWPVLVFEKTRQGDQGMFMSSEIGRKLDFKERLDILCDIASAIRDLHNIGVIHGDVKPENILVFSQIDGRFTTKVTDFGYSTIFAPDEDLVMMPNSGIWTAPEQHHRGFFPGEARKMDVYSFGILCLWLLCYNMESKTDSRFRFDFEESRGKNIGFMFDLLPDSEDMEDGDRRRIQTLLSVTLKQDPRQRPMNFNDLISLLSSNGNTAPSFALDSISIPHGDFQIDLSLPQIIQAHYKVRCYIVKCLQDMQKCRITGQLSDFNLALCYELGFRSLQESGQHAQQSLDPGDISVQSLQIEVERIRRISTPPAFQDGLFNNFLQQGHFSTFDLSQQYREEQQLSEVETRLTTEIRTAGIVLGNGHFLVQELRRQLSLVLASQGRWNETEILQLQMVALENGEERAYYYFGDAKLLLASTYRRQGRWGDAKTLEAQVVETREKVLGRKHPETLTSLANLAATYWHLGQWKEAEKLELTITQISKETLGPEHPRTLLIMTNLAATYREQGRWGKAEDIQTEVISTRKSVLGEDHPDTLSSIDGLTSTYLDQGRWEEAEILQLQVVEAAKRVLGLKHPTTLSFMSNLALAYTNLGQMQQAEDLQLEVMDIRTQFLGPEHPETLDGIANLAQIYIRCREWKKAENLETQILQIGKNIEGPIIPHRLTAMSIQAQRYWGQKKFSEAVPIQLQVMEMSRDTQGLEHPLTLSSMHDLASTYNHLGKLQKAEELLLPVLDIRKRLLGEDHPDVLLNMDTLGGTYQRWGRHKEAEALQLRVIQASSKVSGSEHPNTLLFKANLATILWSSKQWARAEELYLQVIETKKRVLGVDHQDTLTDMSNLVVTFSDQEKWTKAAKLGKEVVEARKRILGPEHLDTLASMQDLARAYVRLGNRKEAGELQQSVIETRQKVQGIGHPDTLWSHLAAMSWNWADGKQEEK